MAGFLPFDEPNLMCLYRKVRLCFIFFSFSYRHKQGIFLGYVWFEFQISKADFAFPSWFSSGAKNLVRRILDPDPTTVSLYPVLLFSLYFLCDLLLQWFHFQFVSYQKRSDLTSTFSQLSFSFITLANINSRNSRRSMVQERLHTCSFWSGGGYNSWWCRCCF